MDSVNVLYCFDSKFWRMAAVSIESLLGSAGEKTQIKIYCMVAPHTSGRGKIEKIIKSHKSGAGLVWRTIKKHENPFQDYEYSRWSPVIFYRCFAHRVFPDVDKLLYLDSDTLICRDVAELYNTDVSDYVLGAVRDMAPINDPFNQNGIYVSKFANKYLNDGPYFNSGVLLLNIKKMTEYEHLLFETKIPLYYPDQDLINVAFAGKIKMLPLKYNVAPGVRVSMIFPEEEALEAINGGQVITHCYSVKPYDSYRAPDQLYGAFAKYAGRIGMYPDMFVKIDKKYARRRVKETFIPHIKICQNTILFFGLKIPIFPPAKKNKDKK